MRVDLSHRAVVGRDRRLVVATHRARRVLGKAAVQRVSKEPGLAKNILSTRLQKLVAHGVLKTAPASDGSAYQEYQLTDKGRDLYLVLVALRQWGERQLFAKSKPELRLVDRKKGQPVKPLELRSQDGRLLGPSDLRTETSGR